MPRSAAGQARSDKLPTPDKRNSAKVAVKDGCGFANLVQTRVTVVLSGIPGYGLFTWEASSDLRLSKNSHAGRGYLGEYITAHHPGQHLNPPFIFQIMNQSVTNQ